MIGPEALRRNGFDAHEDGVAEGQTIWVDGLPGRFVFAIGEGGGEADLNSGLRPGLGGIEGNFIGGAELGAANEAQAVARIPVAGAAVLHSPLLVDDGAIGKEGAIFDGEIGDKGQVVDAVCGVGGGRGDNDGGHRSGLHDLHWLGRLDDESRFDERGLGSGGDEWRGGREGCAG